MQVRINLIGLRSGDVLGVVTGGAACQRDSTARVAQARWNRLLHLIEQMLERLREALRHPTSLTEAQSTAHRLSPGKAAQEATVSTTTLQH